MNNESDDDDDGQGKIGSDNGSQSSEYSSSDEDDDDEQVGLKGNVQLYYEDNINFPCVEEKIQYLIGLRLTLADPPDLDEEPYGNKLFKKKKKDFKPSVESLKKEAIRRKIKLQKTNLSRSYLITLLDKVPLCTTDVLYVKKKEREYRKTLQERIDRNGKENPSTTEKQKYLSHDNKLRLVCCMFDESVKDNLRSTQEVLNRDQLDARNSVLHVTSWYEGVTDLYNDPDYLAEIPALPLLHENYSTARSIKLDEYEFTAAKVKWWYNRMRVMLHEIILNWEKSGNGDGQQRSEDNVDWGKTSLIDCETIDGDNRGHFLTLGGKKPDNEKEWFLLFFWHRMEEEGLVQFVLAKLPNHMAANSNVFNAIASTGGSRNTTSRTEIAAGVTAVGEAMRDFVTELETANTNQEEYRIREEERQKSQEISRLEEEIFQLEMRMGNSDRNVVPEYQINIMTARKLKLEEDVHKLKTN